MLLLAIASLSAYSLAPTLVARGAAPPATDPAQQGVIGYLRAHVGLAAAPTVVTTMDAGQQGVMGYLRAHSPPPPDESGTIWEQAARAVLEYLRAHNPYP